jgi:steroid 5-alpha reductase family enzyme
MPWLIIVAFVGLSLVMLTGWAYQRAVNNGGWTDVFWTFGMGLVGAATALAPVVGGVDAPLPRRLIVAALIGLWALRLGLHILARVLKHPEDARYAAFRTEWGMHFQRNMFVFLQLQAGAGGLLLIAVLLAAHNPASTLGVADAAGALVMLIAIVGEGLADNQLRVFAADPRNRGKVCDVGLWSWSRHPNYFFEWFGWLAYPLIAIGVPAPFGWGWIALGAPAYMYWLLLYVSGVPPLETHMLRSRGDAFRAYQARTSVFFPIPPKA